MKATIGKSYLTVPHEGGELSFAYPAFRGNYGNVAKQIDNEKLKRPNSSKTASLVYDAWKSPKEQYSSEIISILKDNCLWEFTGNLYLPKLDEEINNGVILDLDSQNLKFNENGKLVMDKNSLVQRLKNNDSLVKFVPFGFKTGKQNLIEFEKNPYIQAKYGKEGAEKIAEIASKYKNKPYINSFNSVDQEEARMSALVRSWNFGGRLSVYGDYWYGYYYDGRAFGVCAPGKSQ